jgi:hypothetical protein
MRKRLEELSGRMQSNLLKMEVHGEVVEAFDSKPGEVAGSPPISLVERVKKTG